MILADKLPKRLQAEPHRHLAIPDRLNERKQAHQHQITEPRITTETEFLEYDRPEAEQRAVAERDNEKENRELDVDGSHVQPDHAHDVADQLDHRRQHLAEQEVWIRHHSHPAILGIEEQILVVPQHINQPAVPPLALTAEYAETRGHFGPGDGIGNETDLVRFTLRSQMTTQANDEVHILTNSARAVAADIEQMPPVEHTERTGDDHAATHRIPAESAEEKRAQIFHRLHAGEPVRGDLGVHHSAVFDRARIRHANRPADRRDRTAKYKRSRETLQGVGLDQRVGVDREHVRIARRVNRRIERVGFAAVFLVEHEQLREGARSIVAAHGLRRDGELNTRRYLVEVVPFDEPLHRLVFRAVVHEHDFVTRVL